jgi:curved DNA-binding protein CbpA
MTTKRPDLYAILGVPPNATQAQISHAYRALLRRHHPDTRAPDDGSQNAVSVTTLQQVIAAYTVLHDPARRADYDRDTRPQLHPARRPPQQPPNPYGAHGQPPIIAGPVRWHPTPDQPQQSNPIGRHADKSAPHHDSTGAT